MCREHVTRIEDLEEALRRIVLVLGPQYDMAHMEHHQITSEDRFALILAHEALGLDAPYL